jgi:hypothetical protein
MDTYKFEQPEPMRTVCPKITTSPRSSAPVPARDAGRQQDPPGPARSAVRRWTRSCADEPRDDAFPFVLSAGEHRSFTANTIIRAPSWRGTSSHFPELGALGLFVRFQERRQARRNGVPIFAPVERQGDHHSTEVARLRIASHE